MRAGLAPSIWPCLPLCCAMQEAEYAARLGYGFGMGATPAGMAGIAGMAGLNPVLMASMAGMPGFSALLGAGGLAAGTTAGAATDAAGANAGTGGGAADKADAGRGGGRGRGSAAADEGDREEWGRGRGRAGDYDYSEYGREGYGGSGYGDDYGGSSYSGRGRERERSPYRGGGGGGYGRRGGGEAGGYGYDDAGTGYDDDGQYGGAYGGYGRQGGGGGGGGSRYGGSGRRGGGQQVTGVGVVESAAACLLCCMCFAACGTLPQHTLHACMSFPCTRLACILVHAWPALCTHSVNSGPVTTTFSCFTHADSYQPWRLIDRTEGIAALLTREVHPSHPAVGLHAHTPFLPNLSCPAGLRLRRRQLRRQLVPTQAPTLLSVTLAAGRQACRLLVPRSMDRRRLATPRLRALRCRAPLS